MQTGFTAYANVTHGDEAALAQAVVKQTVIAVAIDASQSNFQFYQAGVYDAPGCKSDSNDLDHGVAVVGYGSYSAPAPTPGTYSHIALRLRVSEARSAVSAAEAF